MKKLYLPLLFVLLLFCSSCVDIEEHYDFKADGSCNVVYGFDMGRALSVLMNLMSDSLKATPQFSASKDTSLNFYTALPDSMRRSLTSEEIMLAQSSNLTVHMNLQKSQMKVNITHQARDAADLQYYLQHISKIESGSELGKMAKGSEGMKEMDAKELIGGQDYYQYTITPHKFYRIIDKTKFSAFLKKTGHTLSMAKAMLIDMPYKVVLNFAHPVKKVNNTKAIVSADRRHVTLVTNMDEIMKNPNVMNLKIDF